MTRFDKIIQNLAKLPAELAFEIINDLRIWDIMKLLAANNPRVNDLLLAHKESKLLLGDDAEAHAKTRDQIKPSLDLEASIPIIHFHPRQMAFLYPKLICSISVWGKEHWPDLTPDMHVYIYKTLHNWPKLDLNRDAIKPIPVIDVFLSVEQFTEHWQALELAKANVVDQYPEQKRRSNTGHVVSQLKSAAARISQVHKKHRFARSEFFRYEFFPLIPFDEALVKLLSWMEEFEVVAGDQLCNPESQHPPSIMETARVVVDGMPFFNSLPVDRAEMARRVITNNKGEVLRTVMTPWSQDPTSLFQGVNKPFFTPHKVGRNSIYRRNEGLQGYEPYSYKEDQWLRSFIELYRYLEALKSSKMD
ncbi:hypothetical protein N7486_006535 [Penicillium sp. IBT 16267x]|nr:hypothetical protein N7486_006535 [Penicillium sp. IBT 16267x]